MHPSDHFTDRHFPAKLLPKTGCGRKMIGMETGFDQPFQGQSTFAYEPDDPVRTSDANPTGGKVDIHDGIDDRAGHGTRIPQHISAGIRVPVEERGHLHLGDHIRSEGDALDMVASFVAGRRPISFHHRRADGG